jgi:hypothetical protein
VKKTGKGEHWEKGPTEYVIGECEFPILKLFNLPRVRHCLEIDLARITRHESSSIAEKTCLMNAEILHLNESIGTLELTLITAAFYPEVIKAVSVDYYATIKLGKMSYKTGMATDSFKQPVWNQKFVIPLEDINDDDDLTITFYSQATFSDKLIGVTSVGLLDEHLSLLAPTNKLKTQSVNITDNGNELTGSIQLEYRLYLN